ncbi:MAG: glycosyltransferase [Candidatus Omnitrophica bacterium]|nr:glycosyltransferase [Candidatus Omnitrophota bacterium]
MKAVAVLSNEIQHKKLAEAYPCLSDILIFCDNPQIYSYLGNQKINFRKVDDFALKSQWAEINAWGCGRAAKWIEFCRERSVFKTIDLASTVYLFFSHLLCQAVKNLLFSEIILKCASPAAVITFKPFFKTYPDFSGNSYLNYLLQQKAKESALPMVELDSSSINSGESGGHPVPPELSAKFKNQISKIHASFFHPPKHVDILAIGSLRHLGRLLQVLSSQGISTGIYDSAFNANLFSWSQKNRIPYMTSDSYRSHGVTPAEYDSSAAFQELSAGLRSASDAGFFHYKEDNLSPFILDLVLPSFYPFLKQLGKRYEEYEKVFQATKVKAILTEDDYALRGGFLGAFAKRKKIPVYCLSHANLAVNFAVPTDCQVFHQSSTLVQSQYEKDFYVRRGWNPKGIVVTGTPRYDELIREFKKRLKKSFSSKIKLLYCANTYITPQTPDHHGYLGIHDDSFQQIVEPAARSFFKILREFKGELEVIFKPHNTMGLGTWKRLFKEYEIENKIRVVSDPKSEIITLIHQCDAMILSSWSTTIIEAVLCQLPVIFMDLSDKNRERISDFEKRNFIQVARNENEIKQALNRLKPYEKDTIPWKNLPSEEIEFFLGKSGTDQAGRVANFIQKSLKITPRELASII